MSPSIPVLYLKFVIRLPPHAALPQVGRYATGLMGASSAPWLGFILAVLLIGFVVVPAVWSNRPTRRKAAIDVLERLIRLLRPGAR